MNAPAQAERRKLGKLKWFALVFIVLIAAVLFVSYMALNPANFTPLLLERIGQATGLDIQAKGQTEINWRGTPYIVLREVSARSPGQKTAVLTADRIKIALPWVTLRSRGQVLVLDRVELDAPVLDLQAFRAWQDTRPKTKSEIPDFKRGVSVTRGTVIGRGWRVESLDIQVPAFSMQAPVQGTLAGLFTNDALRMRFDLGAALSRPASGAGVGINGSASLLTSGWALATRPRLKGILSLGKGDVRMRNGTLGAFVEYRTGTDVLPMSLGLHGDWLLNSEGLQLSPAQVALRGNGRVPQLDANGKVHVGREMDLALSGQIAQWPSAWPALPSPLNRYTGPMAFTLAYEGDTRLTEPLALALDRPDAKFDGRFRAQDVVAWTHVSDRGTPIPPLQGRLKAKRLDIGDIRLEGVEINIEQD